ncbi:MAG: Lrp/AsnC family transcriptional regulator [Weeksellaceae bacterium]|jgi:Lrp/AsnC family leucine-responsive transcriptional regulator|nr:Lrp/AsnC family transcriptional regulator [Weeksellaceae bacterium]MDX9704707.1 Lrp/AsnC family transcriptional regulator [Weeksellaceae bacterium]
MILDKVDLQLLNLLQEDAKITHKKLSVSLNLSTTAVYERIKKLEKSGIIKKYTALLDRKVLGKELMVMAHLRLDRHSRDNITDFEQQISLLKEVHECYHVSGEYDYILKMTFSDMDAYRDFMVRKLTSIPGVGNSHSMFVINEVKNEVGYKL